MNFGEALKAVKDGKNIARENWNGKEQFVYLIKAQELSTGLHYRFGEYSGKPHFVDVLAIKTSKGDIQVGWLATQTDMLSEDWHIVQKEIKMSKYQKKPVTIEAWKLNHKDSADSAPRWLQKALLEESLYYVDNHTWHRLTLEGEIIAEDGDYLIQGVHGEIYSCKPDIFEETYTKVD